MNDLSSSPRDARLLPSSLSASVIAQSAVMVWEDHYLHRNEAKKKICFQTLSLKRTSVPRQPLCCGHECFAVSPDFWSLGYLGGSLQPFLSSYMPRFFFMERSMWGKRRCWICSLYLGVGLTGSMEQTQMEFSRPASGVQGYKMLLSWLRLFLELQKHQNELNQQFNTRLYRLVFDKQNLIYIA